MSEHEYNREDQSRDCQHTDRQTTNSNWLGLTEQMEKPVCTNLGPDFSRVILWRDSNMQSLQSELRKREREREAQGPQGERERQSSSTASTPLGKCHTGWGRLKETISGWPHTKRSTSLSRSHANLLCPIGTLRQFKLGTLSLSVLDNLRFLSYLTDIDKLVFLSLSL